MNVLTIYGFIISVAGTALTFGAGPAIIVFGLGVVAAGIKES